MTQIAYGLDGRRQALLLRIAAVRLMNDHGYFDIFEDGEDLDAPCHLALCQKGGLQP